MSRAGRKDVCARAPLKLPNVCGRVHRPDSRRNTSRGRSRCAAKGPKPSPFARPAGVGPGDEARGKGEPGQVALGGQLERDPIVPCRWRSNPGRGQPTGGAPSLYRHVACPGSAQAARLSPAVAGLQRQRARQLARRDRAGGARLRPDRQPARDGGPVPRHAVPAGLLRPGRWSPASRSPAPRSVLPLVYAAEGATVPRARR